MKYYFSVIASLVVILGSWFTPAEPPDHIRQTLEQAVLKLGKDPGFEREWETVVLRGTKFGGVYSTEEVVKAVRIYMEWKPSVLKTYRRLGFQPPK